MQDDTLMHLIYTSAATPKFHLPDLKTILHGAHTKNAQRAVTGMLLYTTGTFFQVLEGEKAVLMDLFTIISADPRHHSVTRIIHEPIAQRAFGDWTMGFVQLDPEELKGIDGFSDFFEQGNSLINLQPGRAKKLLTAFAQGRWRARLNGNNK